MHKPQSFRPARLGRAIQIDIAKCLLASMVAAICLASSFRTTSAQAVSYTWTNASGGNWLTDGNWNAVGAPDEASDTATLGNISGAYTATLGSATTIGGLNLSGSDPTVTLNGALTISGPVNVSGGLINGTGTMVWTQGNTINWTAGTPGGTLTFLVPHENTVVVNNTPGTFALASGQKLWLAATGGIGGFPGDFTDRTTTFSNGFENGGVIQLGNPTPGDNYGVNRLIITAGTLTNQVGGNINFYPRSANSPNSSGPPWNTREIRSSVQNDGTISSFASDGIIGGTGKTVVNSITGSIKADHSIYALGHIPKISIEGTSFTNNGAIQVGANAVSGQGGIVAINSATIDLNAGSITGPGTLQLSGNTVNVNGGTISGLSTLQFGRNTVATTVNWNIADLTDPTTFLVPYGANVTLNRTTAWTLPSNQMLWFDGLPSAPENPSSLTINQNFNNNGVLRMGRAAPGDNYVSATLNLTGSATFTNNSGGLIEMLPRHATNDGEYYNRRWINANVINNGTINTYASGGLLGDSGKTVVNAGSITVDSMLYDSPRKAQLQMAGNSFTNSAGGTIQLNNGIVWFNTPTVNYNGGSIAGTAGGTIKLGSATIDTNFIFNGGADITGPITWRVAGLTDSTITRSSTWNIGNGGGIYFEAPSDGMTRLTVNQNMTNSGLIQMGTPQPGDNYVYPFLRVNSTDSRLTNNADGVITMYPRSATDLASIHSVRTIEAELINNGQLTSFTNQGFIGKSIAGIDHVNNGTITLNNSILTGATQPQLNFLGDTFTNAANGVINGNGILNVTTLNGAADILQNAGTLSPGMSAGILTVQGNVNFQSGGELLIEITGENAVVGVDYDRLIVAGNVTNLSLGDLVVNITDDDLDLTGDVFTILTSSTDFTGMKFDSVSFVGSLQYKGDVIYGNGFIQLANIASYVPEPSSGCLLLLGLLALRKRKARPAAC